MFAKSRSGSATPVSQSTEIYLRADPTEKLEALAAMAPPTLRPRSLPRARQAPGDAEYRRPIEELCAVILEPSPRRSRCCRCGTRHIRALHICPEVDRRRPDQHPDPGRRRDHRPSAASTRRKAPSTPRPTRTLTPSGRAISMRGIPLASPGFVRIGNLGDLDRQEMRRRVRRGRTPLPIQPPGPPAERLARQSMRRAVVRPALATGPPRLHVNPPVRLALRR